MSKYTPGPWMAIGNGSGGADIVGRAGNVVQVIFASNDRDQQNADALLIASAPTMLEALRAITEEAGDLYGHEGPSGFGTINRMTYLARAAIEKATGGNP